MNYLILILLVATFTNMRTTGSAPEGNNRKDIDRGHFSEPRPEPEPINSNENNLTNPFKFPKYMTESVVDQTYNLPFPLPPGGGGSDKVHVPIMEYPETEPEAYKNPNGHRQPKNQYGFVSGPETGSMISRSGYSADRTNDQYGFEKADRTSGRANFNQETYDIYEIHHRERPHQQIYPGSRNNAENIRSFWRYAPIDRESMRFQGVHDNVPGFNYQDMGRPERYLQSNK